MSMTNDQGLPSEIDPRTGVEDASAAEVVRSEEQLSVGTVSTPVRRVRFRKVIVSEERTVTVTVRREELRVDEEPISADEADVLLAGITATETDTEDAFELVLHEEQIEVVTRVVPIERVRVSKDVVTVETPVTESVRREQVETVTEGLDRV
jgi:uncharacterized protein (TIGR02271 family)